MQCNSCLLFFQICRCRCGIVVAAVVVVNYSKMATKRVKWKNITSWVQLIGTQTNVFETENMLPTETAEQHTHQMAKHEPAYSRYFCYCFSSSVDAVFCSFLFFISRARIAITKQTEAASEERRQNTICLMQCLHISAKFCTNNTTQHIHTVAEWKEKYSLFVSPFCVSFYFVFLRKCFQMPHHGNSVSYFHSTQNKKEFPLSIGK